MGTDACYVIHLFSMLDTIGYDDCCGFISIVVGIFVSNLNGHCRAVGNIVINIIFLETVGVSHNRK